MTLTSSYPFKIQFTLLWYYSWFLEHPAVIGWFSCRISHKDATRRERVKFKVYAENTVNHIMSEKAVSRALFA